FRRVLFRSIQVNSGTRQCRVIATHSRSYNAYSMDWKKIRHHISVISLGVSIVTLPLSITLCHGAVIIFLITWLVGGHWKEKWHIAKENFLLHLIILFFLIHTAGLLYSENIADGFFDIEKKIFMILIPIAIVTSRDIGKRERSLILSLF